MLQFSVGDKAVYPAQGVAEVVGIEQKEISGSVHQFYALSVLETGMRILVPVNNVEQVGLRPVAGEQDIQEVYGILRERDILTDKQAWNRRYRGFMEKIKTGNLLEVAEVYRDLAVLGTRKVLAFGERRMMDTARNLLVKELAVAKKAPEPKVRQELEQLFKAA